LVSARSGEWAVEPHNRSDTDLVRILAAVGSGYWSKMFRALAASLKGLLLCSELDPIERRGTFAQS